MTSGTRSRALLSTNAYDYSTATFLEEYDHHRGKNMSNGIFIDGVYKKIQLAEVQFEEISGDLTDGVVTKAMRPPVATVVRAYYRDVYFYKHVDCGEKQDDGSVILTIESSVKCEDMVNIYEAWLVCHSYGLKVLETLPVRLENAAKIYKCTQRFRVKITRHNTMPCFQMYCNVKKMKFMDSNFREGDIVSVFVRGNATPAIASPGVLTVSPKFKETYVPLQPKQRLQIVTHATDAKLTWTPNENSTLSYKGEDIIYNEHNKFLSLKKIKAHFFECLKPVVEAETILVDYPEKDRHYTIIVPVNNRKNSRYPVIVNPENTFIVYAHNIDGFIIKNYNHRPVTVDKECPVRIQYAYSNKECYEVKIRIQKSHSYFTVERCEDSWLVKLV